MTSPKDLSDIFVAGYLPALALLTLCRWLIFPGLPIEIQKQLSLMKDAGYLKEFTLLVIIPIFFAAILVSLIATTVQLYSGLPLFRPNKPQAKKYKEFNRLVNEIETQQALLLISDPNVDDELKKKIQLASSKLRGLIDQLMKLMGGVVFVEQCESYIMDHRLGSQLFSWILVLPGIGR